MKDYVRQNMSTYNLLAEHYNSNAKMVEGSIAKIIDSFMAYCPQHAVILELGCGAGVATKALLDKGSAVYVVDFSEKMIAAARQRAPEAIYFCEDILSWRPDDNMEFDGAFLSAFVHLFCKDDAIAILKKIVTKLKPSGCIYIDTTLNGNTAYSEKIEPVLYHPSAAPRLRARHTEESFKQLIEAADLSIAKEWRSVGYDGKSEWIDVIAILR